MLKVGDKVTINGASKCIVKYIGQINGKEGTWIGLESNIKVNRNDGIVNGKKYFDCKESHGFFIKQDEFIKKIYRVKENIEKTNSNSGRLENEDLKQKSDFSAKDSWKVNESKKLEENAGIPRNAKETNETDFEIKFLKVKVNQLKIQLENERNKRSDAVYKSQEKEREYISEIEDLKKAVAIKEEECQNLIKKANKRNEKIKLDVNNLIRDILGNLTETMNCVYFLEKNDCVSSNQNVESSKVDKSVQDVVFACIDDDDEKLANVTDEFKELMKKVGVNLRF